MMRRASTYLALLGSGVVGVLASTPVVASAAPSVTFKAAAVPIPVNLSKPHSATYPGTGNILGAGAAIETEFQIAGNEYGEGATAGPPPLRQVTIKFPAGAKVHLQGFTTCSIVTLEHSGPGGCPKKSYASAQGEANGYVSLGGERVHEKVAVQGFFISGGLAFYVSGTTPVSIEIVSKGSVNPASSGPVGNFEVPLIPSVPGALDATATQIKVKVGAAYKKGKKLVSYATLPTKCPKGGFPISAELKFGTGASSSEWVTSSVSYKAPCPRRK
jgi:hypothetical protein